MLSGMPSIRVWKSVPWSRLNPRMKYWLALPSPECWVTISPGTVSSSSPSRVMGRRRRSADAGAALGGAGGDADEVVVAPGDVSVSSSTTVGRSQIATSVWPAASATVSGVKPILAARSRAGPGGGSRVKVPAALVVVRGAAGAPSEADDDVGQGDAVPGAANGAVHDARPLRGERHGGDNDK